jgi:Right handed beta helix region/Cep192 domain 4
MSLARTIRPKSPSLLAVCTFLLAATATNVQAQNTILVPRNYPTIQSAINSANNGDTVLVSAGTYVENINFIGKAITVTSSGGPATTIIDGNHNGTVVTFNHSETAASVLSGFTIRNGYLDGGSGAGIAITSASPTITSNVVTSNHAAAGLGIFVNGGSPLIQSNTISNNDQMNAGDGGSGGGGILVYGGSSGVVQIIGNTITNNNMQSGGQGGGISVAGGGALLQGNFIRGNIVYNDGGGITAYNVFAPLTITQNVIVNNTALTGKGGGVNLSLPSSSAAVFVTNNTIANNTAYANTSGIYTTGFAQPATLTNNIIVAPSGQNPVTCDGTYSTASPTFSHNDAYSVGSSSPGFFGFCVAGSSGNFSADPLFLSAPNNDFHLSSASPALDAGDNSAPSLPAVDFDGNPRIADGNSDGTSVIDLGAFELAPTSAASLAPNSLTFGTQGIGSTSAAQTVTLTSSGSTGFQITSIQVSGDFAQTTNCPVLASPGTSAGVAGGSSCTFNVTFTPTATGTRTGSLTVNGTNGASLAVPLTGTAGTIPQLSLSAASLSFNGQAVGSPGVPQNIILTNAGGAPFYFTYIKSSSSSFVQTNNCGASLAMGASCTISVTFLPSSANFFSGQIDIYDGQDILSYSVLLSGSGVDFYLSSSGGAFLLAGYSGQFPVTANVLGGSIYPDSVTLSCSGMPSNTTCGFSPATTQAGFTSQTVNMNISAQFLAPGGTYPLTITGVSANGYSHSQQFMLTIGKPAITLSASTLTYAAQPVGVRSAAAPVTLTSAGTGVFNFSSITTSGPFAQTNNCHSTLPNYSSCTVSVTFAPTAYGTASGTLSILDNVDGLSYSVALTGTGTDFSIATSVPSLNVVRGGGNSLTVNFASLGGPFQNSISLSCSGIPGKISCAFSPVSVAPGAAGGSSTLTISADPSAIQTGTYTIAIVGSSGSLTHSTPLQLTIANKH